MATVVAAMVALGGCSGLRASREPPLAMPLPAAWSGSAESTTAEPSSLLHWWQRFDDPLLSRLVSQALEANTTVTGAQAAVRQARALRDVTAAGLLPSLDGSASVQRSRSGNAGTANRFAVGLDAGWELDVFGARDEALKAGEATARASAASLGDVRVSVSAEVALAYIGLRSAQARLAIANANLAGQMETQQLTQWRVQAGLLSSLEDEQARAAAAQTRAQIPALQTTIEQSRHALAVLTGQPPAALADTLSSTRPVPQVDATVSLAVPAETLRQRPDVRAAEYQVSAALARVAQADAQRLPSFRLSGSLGLSALTPGGLTHGAAVAAALLAGASMPLFDGGAGKAQVDAQEAAAQQAVASYRATVLSALQEVEDALVALRGDRERLQQLRQAAEAAANAALLARQRFDSGLVDFQTVLDTQRTQLSTQDNLAGAAADVSTDHVRLFKALGGGWRSDDARPALATNDNISRTVWP